MNQLRRRIQTAAMSGGKAVPPLPPFNPLDIAGLKLWLDASQIVGLNDGDSVTTWSDLSGQGNDVTQATASKKPTYQTAEINSLPVVRFDGVDDSLANTSFSFMQSASAGTLIVVSRITNPAAAQWVVDLNNAQLSKFQNVNLGIAYVTGQYGYKARNNTNAELTTIVYDGTLSGNDNRCKLRFDRVAQNPLTFGGTIAATTSGSAGYAVGSRVNQVQFLGGDVALALFYNRALTTDEITQVENWAASVWGTP